MIYIDKDVIAYLEISYKKIRQLRMSDKGEVWLALDRTKRFVIIKRISFTGLPYILLKENQFRICPHIVHCVESSTETVVIEEFIQGVSLLERLSQKNYFTESEAQDTLIQLCDGLEPLHKCGIIHRDIKPSNIIMQDDGSVRLIDFDAARVVKENATEDTKLLGTKGYAPPEQFGYGQTDQRSDIYSLGVTIKNLLGKEYNGKLIKILNKCTEIDPNKRYSTVIELKKAILYASNEKTSNTKQYVFWAIMALLIPSILYWKIEIPQEAEPQNQGLTVEHKEVNYQEENKKISTEEENKYPTSVAKFPELPLQNELEKLDANEKYQLEQPIYPAIQIQENPPIETQKIKPSGRVETALYLNDEMLNLSQSSEIKTKLEDWNKFQVRLHITNNTGNVFAHSTIKIVVGDNFGSNNIEEKSLPPLRIGESTDIDIPLQKYPIATKARSKRAWLQIWLNGNDSLLEERYWCIKFSF